MFKTVLETVGKFQLNPEIFACTGRDFAEFARPCPVSLEIFGVYPAFGKRERASRDERQTLRRTPLVLCVCVCV